jgi:hypothetical protein
LLTPRYARIGLGSDGLFPFQIDGSWGYINTRGETAIEAKFEAVQMFENGTGAVKSNGRWDYVRTDGSMETNLALAELAGRQGPYIVARDAKGWAAFKLTQSGGAPVREQFYGFNDLSIERALSISEGSITAKYPDGVRLFLIDLSFSNGAPDVYSLIQAFPQWEALYKLTSILPMKEGFAAAATAANKWGFLHKASGEFLWRDRFESALGFSKGLAPVKIGGKWGYVDRFGRMAITPTYDAAFPFRGEYAVIRQGEKRGFLRLGAEGGISTFIAPQYEDAYRFTEGLAPVKMGGRWGYISDGQPWTELVDTGIANIRPP